MSPSVRLDDLILALEMDSDESATYVDCQTGHVVAVQHSTRRAVEANDEKKLSNLPDWQQAEIDLARAIVADEERDGRRFIPPPDKFDFHEYRHMERFIGTLETVEIAAQLWQAIKGKGAFRYFRDTLHRLGLEKRWYAYRDEAMKQFVLDWAEANGVAVVDEPPRQPPG